MNGQDTTPRWLAEPAACWTGTGDDAGGGVVVAGNRIVELVPGGGRPATAGALREPVHGLVLLPGLVNCHHHFYQTLTRAYPAAQGRELFAWLKALYPVWERLDAEGVAAATELALCELLLSGCTTSTDHHYIFSASTGPAIDRQVEAAAALGARVVLTRGSMSLGESRGGLPPDSVVQDEDAIVADCERLVGRYHDPADDALCQIALAPTSPFSVSAELMRAVAGLAEASGVLLHTHLGETRDENDFCVEHYGQRPVDYLEDTGWLRPGTWLAHGIHFIEAELARLGAARVGVSHCPSSNLFLASGLCPVLDLEAAGCPVGLGVDGSSSNDHSNLMEETRQAMLVQRLRYGSGAVAATDALRWATTGGADLLQRPALGRLAPGAVADLALFDPAEDLRFSGAGDLVAALVTSGARRARHVMVNGRWRVRDYAVEGVDLPALRARHAACAQRLLAG
jgi:8-oxoguanine deaminase